MAVSSENAIAERMKVLHGGVVATGLDDRELISAPVLGGEGQERTLTRAALIGVIRPRVEEIFEEVRMLLDRAGFQGLPSRRIVLTGGGSQLPGLPQNVTGPAFSALVGLAVYSVRPHDEFWDFEAPSGLSGGTRMRRAVRWFRDNW